MPPGTEPRQDLLASETTEEEHAEGIGIERIGDEVADGGGVLAGIGPVRAGAAGLQLAWSREQIEADGVRTSSATPGGKLAIEERRSVADLGRQRIEHRSHSASLNSRTRTRTL